MEIIKPSLGLIFWMVISFSIVLIILYKIAWKPILKIINEREEKINKAIENAELLEKKIKEINLQAEEILNDAHKKANEIIKEASEIKEKIISDARTKAQEESERIIKNTMQKLEKEKEITINEIKNEIINYALLISEKILKEELSDKTKNEKYLSKIFEEINFN